MFLQATLERNPELIDAAIELHRSGEIGPNTFVLDIDQVVQNAELISAKARQLNLGLHVMTKQQGRNPFMALASLHGGIPDAVAVDVAEARLLRLHRVPLGHIGHLVQVPARDTDDVVSMDPAVVTVFSIDAARRLADVASELGKVQDLLLRVWKPGDFLYPGQEGGFRVDDVVASARVIDGLHGVRVVGVTSFPCLIWDEAAGGARPTGNLDSVTAAAEMLRDGLGLELTEINAPAMGAVGTMDLIAKSGATHTEPGSSLSGSTPLHATGTQPETPALVYVSEVSATDGDVAYCFGGGFYARSRISRALLVDRAGGRRLTKAPQLPPEVIDYYGTIQVPREAPPRVGDTVVFAFRSQVFVGRCQVAAVSGLRDGRPRVMGICDQHGNLVGNNQLPLSAEEAGAVVRQRWREYVQSSLDVQRNQLLGEVSG